MCFSPAPRMRRLAPMTNTSFGVAPPGPVPGAIPAPEPTVLAQIERLIRLDLCRSGPVDDAAWRAHERQQAAGVCRAAAAGPPVDVEMARKLLDGQTVVLDIRYGSQSVFHRM